MAAHVSAITSPLTFITSFGKTHFKISPVYSYSVNVHGKQPPFRSKSYLTLQASHNFRPFPATTSFSKVRASSDGYLKASEEIDNSTIFEERPIKVVFLVLLWASLSLAWFAASGDAKAAADSIRASNFGLKIANALRSSGWPDTAVVFALATLPVLELRGAIPVGYWMQLNPGLLTVLSVIGNMVPVPFIILYLKRFATFLAARSPSASRFLNLLFDRAKEKAGPVKEFQWLGLMLFVAVPFPGTGAVDRSHHSIHS
ncbi:Small multi-drug export protein [Quillaja saponaria]|uniref:Small multi-drug export protein n=1 Tax=Quillaja saponaria TaxID=32244 RepID=A0AAD7PG73_QUISA|nr:Small multi-drug export protein [Quillaja saponaria]